MRGQYWFHVTALCLTGLWLQACVGQRTESRVQNIQVSTDPPGAQIWIQDPTGKRLLGTSPREVEQKYETEVTEFNRWLWVTVPVSALGIGFGGALTYYGRPDNDENTGSGQLISGISLLGVCAIGLAVSLAYSILGEQAHGREQPTVEKVVLGAELAGYQTVTEYMEIPAPSAIKVDLKLAPTGATSKAEPKDGQPRQIVAVFDLQDDSKTLAPETVVQLTSYLGTLLTKHGDYSVVPRDQLRERLQQEKAGTYKACYDESCQIELGKAVAAQKSLATTLMKIGEKCPITANLIDLKTETVEKGASTETGCSQEELLGAMKDLAQQLANR